MPISADHPKENNSSVGLTPPIVDAAPLVDATANCGCNANRGLLID